MNQAVILPNEVLPHGKGMQLLRGDGVVVDGWLTYDVVVLPDLSVVHDRSWAPPELGVEIMAQACGMVSARTGEKPKGGRRIGFVGAVRGYEYECEPFAVGTELRVRVKADVVEENLLVCDGELFLVHGDQPIQRARITLILTEQELP